MCQHGTGAPATLAAAAQQEGFAGASAGQTGTFHPGVADVLAVLGVDTSLATMVAFLYGDAAAEEMGFRAIGLDGRTGYDHAVAMAHHEPQLSSSCAVTHESFSTSVTRQRGPTLRSTPQETRHRRATT